MSKQKLFQMVMIFYVVLLSFIVGLVIHKFASTPKQLVTPTVSYRFESTDRPTPPADNVVNQFYQWMHLDSERSRTIFTSGMPIADEKSKKVGILDLVLDPKKLFTSLISWTVGIDYGKPETYVASSIPQMNPTTRPSSPVVSSQSNAMENTQSRSRGTQVIESGGGTIYINVPQDEMLAYRQTPPPDQPQNQVVQNPSPTQNPSVTDTPRVTTTPEQITRPPVEIAKRKPRVLIYHTHGSETYADDPNPKDSTWHTLLPNLGRVVTAGAELAKVLTQNGFEVYHDTTSYDGRNFNMAYDNARKNVEKLLKEQHFDLVLDIHRDGEANPAITRNAYIADVNRRSAARIMFVVGQGRKSWMTADQARAIHPNWQMNYNIARALESKMNGMYPGVMRRIDLRENKLFNQDLHPHLVLVELGSQLNTTADAIYGAQLLANVIIEVFKEQNTFLLD